MQNNESKTWEELEEEIKSSAKSTALIAPVDFTMSSPINELALALSKAQGEIESANKSSSNPFFKSKYADLAEVWDTAREPLSKNGLSICQIPSSDGDSVVLTTILLHSSGQYISGVLKMKPSDTKPQTLGSCITYARRYALSAFVGIAQADDDGNEASKPKEPQAGFKTTPISAQNRQDVLNHQTNIAKNK